VAACHSELPRAEPLDLAAAADLAAPISVDVDENRRLLLSEEDTDGDARITIDDRVGQSGRRGDATFLVLATDGRRYRISSTYHVSNLLQELTLAAQNGHVETVLDPARILENPVDRISRHIRELYWDGLTRRIDADHLPQILHDEKTATSEGRFLYVPHDDAVAYAYFSDAVLPETQLNVVRLPDEVTPAYVEQLEGRHGLLTLALQSDAHGLLEGVPFVVPGGRFNEMYGWDSYFEALGLLQDGRLDLARSMVDNFVYEIHHYGRILNANRTYYLTRSQPPFLTSMALAVHERLANTSASKHWLAEVIRAAIREYDDVWMNEDHLTHTGLSRYFGSGIGPPPEVEPGHFDPIYARYAGEMDVREFERLYRSGRIAVPQLDAFFVHDRAMRESGHDTTYRWTIDGRDRCADFVTVDLNSLLYKFEIDIARTIRDVFDDQLDMPDGTTQHSDVWVERSRRRRRLMRKLLWDEERRMFFDYDIVHERRNVYFSATCLYPLWAMHPDDPSTRILSPEEARRLVTTALETLEMPGGLAASAWDFFEAHRDTLPARQWDYPNGWAPHQMLAWRGLLNQSFTAEAQRLIYKWLYTITRNAADYNGTVPEKFDVVHRTHKVFAEYGNVNTEFEYITKEGFGWMNASYQVGLSLLPGRLRQQLEALVPPEDLF
jgi:alpha,alpha-trehalase